MPTPIEICLEALDPAAGDERYQVVGKQIVVEAPKLSRPVPAKRIRFMVPR
jgi:hypothetical protein